MALRTARGAITVYLVVLAVLGAILIAGMALASKDAAQGLVLVFMFVPAVSALVAWAVTRQRIRFGRPDPRSLALGVVPVLVMVVMYSIGLAVGIEFLGFNLEPVSLVILILQACVLAFGEELGWRGYLLPQLRRGSGYLRANAVLTVVWLLYHVPVMLIPGLYSNAETPLWSNLLFFAIAITGFSFYLGALWEISHDVWGPTFAHGLWNQVIQGSLPLVFFTTNPWLMGEFGVLAAIGMAFLLVATAPLAARRYPDPLGPDAGPRPQPQAQPAT